MNSLAPPNRVKKPNTDGCLPTWALNWVIDVEPVTPE